MIILLLILTILTIAILILNILMLGITNRTWFYMYNTVLVRKKFGDLEDKK